MWNLILYRMLAYSFWIAKMNLETVFHKIVFRVIILVMTLIMAVNIKWKEMGNLYQTQIQ